MGGEVICARQIVEEGLNIFDLVRRTRWEQQAIIRGYDDGASDLIQQPSREENITLASCRHAAAMEHDQSGEGSSRDWVQPHIEVDMMDGIVRECSWGGHFTAQRSGGLVGIFTEFVLVFIPIHTVIVKS